MSLSNISIQKVKLGKGDIMKWEYEVLSFEAGGFWSGGGSIEKDELQNSMNELGKEDWELVSIFDTNKNQGETRDVVAVFKRELPS